MRSKGKHTFLLSSGSAVAASSLAQEFRGRIQGTVTDTSQAAISGAAVTIINTAHGCCNETPNE